MASNRLASALAAVAVRNSAPDRRKSWFATVTTAFTTAGDSAAVLFSAVKPLFFGGANGERYGRARR